MGVLTDLVIADRSEAEDIANSVAPLSQWNGLDAKGLNQVTFGTLLCILRDGRYDENVFDEFSIIAQVSDDGAWVFDFPADFASRLIQINESEVSTIALEWLKTEEMQNAGSEYAESFIRDLKILAKESTVQQKSLFMWMCL